MIEKNNYEWCMVITMEQLKNRILSDAKVKSDNIIKVDGFINHQIDINLMNEIGKEFKSLFKGEDITKIITIEASGIAIACLTALHFDVPVVFAKKSESKNIDGEVYKTLVTSYTRGKEYTVILEKRHLTSEDRILIVDDILATGKAQRGLLDISNQAGADVAGIGIVIEKGFQGGGDQLRSAGYNVQSLAIIDSMENETVIFRD